MAESVVMMLLLVMTGLGSSFQAYSIWAHKMNTSCLPRKVGLPSQLWLPSHPRVPLAHLPSLTWTTRDCWQQGIVASSPTMVPCDLEELMGCERFKRAILKVFKLLLSLGLGSPSSLLDTRSICPSRRESMTILSPKTGQRCIQTIKAERPACLRPVGEVSSLRSSPPWLYMFSRL